MEILDSFIRKIAKTLLRGERLDNDEFLEFYLYLQVTFLTSILMWSYAFLSFMHPLDETLKYLGFGYTVLHMLSPLVILIFRNTKVCVYLMLSMGVIFQFHYAFFNGGFWSKVTIWFSVLPLLAGIVSGGMHALFWGIVALISTFLLYLFASHETADLFYPTKGFATWAHLNITVGYILLVGFVIWIGLHVRARSEKNIEKKNLTIKNLLRIISHDISNDLVVVLLSLQKLERGMDEEKTQRALKRCMNAANNIKELLNDVREKEAIVSGKMKMELQKVMFSEVLENCVGIFEERIKEKNLTLLYDWERNKDVCLLAEKTSLKNQVINNLLSNAIKFSREGGIVEIEVVEALKDIKVYFKDKGIGIPKDMLHYLFNDDVATSRKGTSGEKGTGFGMPLVYHTMQNYGGSISVESIDEAEDKENSGTVFTLTFQKC